MKEKAVRWQTGSWKFGSLREDIGRSFPHQYRDGQSIELERNSLDLRSIRLLMLDVTADLTLPPSLVATGFGCILSRSRVQIITRLFASNAALRPHGIRRVVPSAWERWDSPRPPRRHNSAHGGGGKEGEGRVVNFATKAFREEGRESSALHHHFGRPKVEW